MALVLVSIAFALRTHRPPPVFVDFFGARVFRWTSRYSSARGVARCVSRKFLRKYFIFHLQQLAKNANCFQQPTCRSSTCWWRFDQLDAHSNAPRAQSGPPASRHHQLLGITPKNYPFSIRSTKKCLSLNHPVNRPAQNYLGRACTLFLSLVKQTPV